MLVMDPRDSVATAIRDLAAGTVARYRLNGEWKTLSILESIPFGHKVAITDIEAGEPVRKYGEVIGRATDFIAAGRHVHVHNLEGLRGRGDWAQPDERG